MSKSSKNSKKRSYQEVGKTIINSNDAKRKKYKNDRLKKPEGAKSQSYSSNGASVVGRNTLSKMKKLKKKKKDLADDIGSDVEEDWMTFLRMGGFHPNVV